MDYGENIKFFLSLYEKGKPSPLDTRPDRDMVTDWFLWAFSALNRSRQTGMGLMPLSMSDILALANSVELLCTKEFFIDVMQSLDYQFLNHERLKQERKQKAKSKIGNPKSAKRR